MAKEFYKNNKIDEELLRKRIIDLAHNNLDSTFYFNKEKYLFKKGLFELASEVDEKNALNFEDCYKYEVRKQSKKDFKGQIDLSLSLTIDKLNEEGEVYFLC